MLQKSLELTVGDTVSTSSVSVEETNSYFKLYILPLCSVLQQPLVDRARKAATYKTEAQTPSRAVPQEGVTKQCHRVKN